MRKQRRFVIPLLLVLALLIFAYVRREIFFQQAKRLMEQKLERSFPGHFAIERIKPAVFGGLVLEKMKVNFAQTSGFAFTIKVERAFIDYSLWETLFSIRPEKDMHRLRLISPELNFSSLQAATDRQLMPRKAPRASRNQESITGEFELILENGRVSFGKWPPFLKNLSGRVLLRRKGIYFQDFRATFKDNPRQALALSGQLEDEGLNLTAHLEHLKINNFDILTNLVFSLNKQLDLQSKTTKISGRLKTYGSVLNNQPFPELSSSFEIQDKRLRILSCSLGEQYNLRGMVSLVPPWPTDLSLNFYQAHPGELIARLSRYLQEDLTLSGAAERRGFMQPEFSGLVNGLIKFSGELSSPRVEGYLEVTRGHIGDLDFVSAHINLEGRFPKILIVDSRIHRKASSFIMEGEIDFSHLAWEDFLAIELKADKGMLWQGWDITRGRGSQVHLSKKIAEDLKITFDTFLEETAEDFGGDYVNELGLGYKIFGDKLLRLRLRKTEGILGVEQRIKF